jgi:NAD(P)-dependent dehydrogenase (short-subunit alcohol dehydrogenase family)
MSWPRTALVTGAGSGLGLALASTLAARGAFVFGLVRRPESLAALAEGTGSRAVAVLGDVTQPSVEAAIQGALAAHGRPLHLLVNNAGAMASGRTLAELDPAEILRLVDLHANGALRCTRAALPALERAERAVVVNVSSRLGSVTRVARGEFDGLRISYAMRISKAALNMATACLARELAGAGIAVHSLHPGRIRTRMASADADVDPQEAAERLLAWLAALPEGATAGYWDTDGNRLPW